MQLLRENPQQKQHERRKWERLNDKIETHTGTYFELTSESVS